MGEAIARAVRPPDGIFPDSGQSGQVMAQLDWAATPLGPVSRWPQSLRAAVRLVLSSRYPMLLLWGEQFIQLYNDAYSALIGDKHPAALGIDVRITLAEGWHVLGPIIDDVIKTGVASWVPALQLLLERAGYREEAYFSVSHAAARDDDGQTAGVFAVCSEVTDQVVGERRLRLLRDLSPRVGPVRSVEETCAQLADALAADPLDVPFAAIYLREGAGLRRAASIGTGADGDGLDQALPVAVDLAAEATAKGQPDAAADPWGLGRAAAGQGTAVVEVADRLRVPAGPWGDLVETALAMPLPSGDPARPLGVVLAGVSPSRALDDGYRSFFELLGQQISVALRNAHAYAEQRQRAEALAELDRVKTGFFTNVSHEFRTPLTLMLGPLADALDDQHDPLSPGQRQRVETAQRNATRLLKLVNNLLTFSSLEAGQASRAQRPVDLAASTMEYASPVRAAVVRAGLRLVVDCPALPEPVCLDPGNWEKIVANLLSNALKFTFTGQIELSLRADQDAVRLAVTDTGIGVPPTELSQLFQRFHRVQGARSRSHEGTGIGLALVQELSRLEGGEVAVRSAVGVGTTFTVTLPWSAVRAAGAPASPGAAGSTLATARAAAEEAAHWLADSDPAELPDGPLTDVPLTDGPDGRADDDTRGARVVIADDNSDMRTYLTRLLRAQGWPVEAVGDGRAALDAVRRWLPDLLLTDVMMPELDGFALVRALRRDPATGALPIVVLSARAGRGASVEGLDLGADDYLVKPFAANELIARLRGTIRLARLRGAHTRRLAALADTAAVITSGRALEEAVRVVTEQARVLLEGRQAVTTLDGGDGQPVLTFVVPETAGADAAGTDRAGADLPGDAAPATAVIRGRHGRELGSIVVRPTPGADFDAERRALLLPIAQMLAALAEGTWQLERQHEVAMALQRSLLPERLPAVPGAVLAGRYLPGGRNTAGDAGGAWYDVVDLPHGRIALVVGDVSGHGLAAVSTMGQLRSAVRSYLAEGAAPAGVLSRLDALTDRLAPARGATVFVGTLETRDGRLAWCAAGDTPIGYLAAGEPPDRLDGSPAPGIGAPGVERVTNRATLGPGAWLLVLAGGAAGDRAGLLPRFAAATGSAQRTADVLDAVLGDDGVGDDGVGDDEVGDGVSGDGGAAVVALAVHRLPVDEVRPPEPPTPLARSWVYRSTPEAASVMRRDVRRALGDAGVDEEVAFEILIAASEAVNNAVEHAQSPTRPEVEVELAVKPDSIRVLVRDTGTWRGRRSAMDRGHGSTLMSAYGEVQVTSTATGTTVTIERRLSLE